MSRTLELAVVHVTMKCFIFYSYVCITRNSYYIDSPIIIRQSQ